MTQAVYYGALFIASMLLLLLYLSQWHKYLDVHITVIFVLIPVVNLSYFMMYNDPNPQAAVNAMKIIYIGGCYLPWVVTMSIAGLCGIPVSRWVRMCSFAVSSLLFSAVLTIGHYPLFYSNLQIEQADAVMFIHKQYGPVHSAHYAVLLLYLLTDLIMLLYTYRRQHQVSKRILFLLFIPIPVSVLGYVFNHSASRFGIEIVPCTYVLAQIVYLFIAQRMAVYNASDMMVESMVLSGHTGFVTVDLKKRFLGSNATAREVLPDLRSLSVDGPVGRTETLRQTVESWIDSFSEDQDSGRHVYYRRAAENPEDDKVYVVTVYYLSDGRRRHGYQIFLDDDTQNQKYIKLLDGYNADLQKDVAAKTEQLEEMHERLILGMATMVESRDNSTGGHIRRTSEGVRMLIDEMRRDESLALPERFCRNLIKAAPMHDLGKIAVDDAVLRKPGPFTPEERKKMERHAAEGARIVHEILKDTNDEEFRRIAENVAHYHHERVDGNGYPDGLRGEEIPLEARIMAIADVYDALVSKRVYKEKLSFEEADRIICEGMGSQFDPALRRYYEQARPRLERFYSAEQT